MQMLCKKIACKRLARLHKFLTGFASILQAYDKHVARLLHVLYKEICDCNIILYPYEFIDGYSSSIFFLNPFSLKFCRF